MRLSARSHAARRHPLGSTLATVGLALVAVLNETPPAQAATFTVLHSFTGPDGVNPYDGLISDPAGSLYGTTFNGGSGCLPYSTCGVIFELERGGNLTVLHAFSGSDGSNPSASLLRDSAGNLYGTTKYGGNNDGCAGCGVVFQLDTAGTETVLHQFAGYNTGGGALPDSSLIWDSALGLCSTAPVAGAYDEGVVFTLNPATGGFSVLYAFEGTGLDDGETPNAALIQDSAGNLYGTTTYGGGSCVYGVKGCGIVFAVDSAGNETVLHRFSGPDGAHPNASLLRYSATSMYGTTSDGGLGSGVVFMLHQTGAETVLYKFTGGDDGANPSAALIRDPAGNVYGTTVSGGASGMGVVFMLSPTGQQTVLHSFTGGSDGANPYGALLRDSEGNLYGTTYGGGSTACSGGCGVVFRLKP